MVEKESKIIVTAEARARLEAIVAAPSMKQKYVWRARIVLLSAAGVGTMAIVRQIGKSKRAVWRWQDRFAAEGVNGLLRDRPRSGRPPTIGPDQGGGAHATHGAARRHALEHAQPGPGGWPG